MADSSFINLSSPEDAFQHGHQHVTSAQDMEDAVMQLVRKTVGAAEGMSGSLAFGMVEVVASIKATLTQAAQDVARVGVGLEKGTNSIVEGDNTSGKAVQGSVLRRPI